MKCPHCGRECMKTAIQMEDLSGWSVGWICGCPPTEENVEVVIHASRDWTAEILIEAGAEGAFGESEDEKEEEDDITRR